MKRPPPPFRRMGKTLLARDLTITARTISVYLDESGLPLHIFHAMKITVRRPDRIAVEFTGDDGKARSILRRQRRHRSSFPTARTTWTIPASGDIPSALNEIATKLDVNFPLSVLFQTLRAKSCWMMPWPPGRWERRRSTAIECRHLFFSQKSGVDLELWVEKNGAATPHRLVVNYPLLQGQPSFVAEFTSWKTQPPLTDSGFTFEPPADVKKIDPTPAVASRTEGSR